MSETRNVFISHIHEDDDKLSELKGLILSHGMIARDYSITSDKPNNASDEKYIKYKILAPKIDRCSILMVLITPQTKESHYVNWEIEYAHKRGKQIVGVWAHGDANCDLPEALDRYGDAVVGWRAQRIIDAINGMVEKWDAPDGKPRQKFEIRRYSC